MSTLTCPYCARPNEMFTSVPGNSSDIPKTGDLTVCVGCAMPAWTTFAASGMILRRLTAAEFEMVSIDPRYRALIHNLIDVHAAALADEEPP